MANEKRVGVPALIPSALTENIRLVDDYQSLVSDLLSRFSIDPETHDQCPLGHYDLCLVISPIHARTLGLADSMKEFPEPPFRIYIFLQPFDSGYLKGVLPCAMVVTQDGALSSCEVHCTGKSLSKFKITLIFDETRSFEVKSILGQSEDFCTVKTGDYVEEYQIENLVDANLRSKFERLTEVKVRLTGK